MKNFRFTLALFTLSILFLTNCSTLKIQSTWLEEPIVIDGNTNDWGENLIAIQNENISIGVLNNEKYLYLCLITQEKDIINQVLMNGLIVWFDSKNEKNKNNAIHFPLRTEPLEMNKKGIRERNEMGKPSEINLDKIKSKLGKAEIIGPDKSQSRIIDLKENKAIEIFLDLKNEILFYEMKVLLNADKRDDFSISADTGKTISICLETIVLNKEGMEGKPHEGGEIGGEGEMPPPGGGMGGGFGGPPPGGGFSGGGMGGPPGGNRMMKTPKSLSLWFDLLISSAKTDKVK
ncbi:MAG: hypothetical protein V1779_13360 [bacterium]